MPERPAVQLPPPVELNLRRSARRLWLDRARQVVCDTYVGAPLMKLPEDLRVYEHLLWLVAPDAVIELGSYGGGSALWLRDRLLTLEHYGWASATRVISVDTDTGQAAEFMDAADPSWRERITLLEGDVCDPDLPALVGRRLPDGSRCIVIEDTAHEYETTLAGLRGFARFVAKGSFYIVEDGAVDVRAMRISKAWPRGVLPAVREWLASEEGSAFRVRRDLELYGVTSNPHGYLERVS